LAAAEQLAAEGIQAEVIDPRTLQPLDEDIILESVRKTNRLVICHEACTRFGFGAEVASVVSEKAFDWLDAPIQRVGAPFLPMPYEDELERQVIPSQQQNCRCSAQHHAIIFFKLTLIQRLLCASLL